MVGDLSVLTGEVFYQRQLTQLMRLRLDHKQEFVAKHRSVWSSFGEFQDTLRIGDWAVALRSALSARFSFRFALSAMADSKTQ